MSKRMRFLGALALLFASVQSVQAGSPCLNFGWWDDPLFTPLEKAFLTTNDPRAFLDAAALAGLHVQSGRRSIARFKAEKAAEKLGWISKCRIASQTASPGGIVTRVTVFYIPGRREDILLRQRTIPLGNSDSRLEFISLTVGYGPRATALLARLK